MTHHDDFLDAGTAERLLAGTVAPADAPPGYGPTAAVLAAARAGVPVLAPNLAELARVAGESASQPGSPSQTRRSPVLVKLLTVKAAAAAGVILLGATSAAAATGSLPGAVQGVAHSVLSKVGVDVPGDSTEPAGTSNKTKDSKPDESTSTTLPAGDQSPTGVPAGTPGSDDPANHDAADSQGDDQSNDSADDQGQDAADAGTGDQSGDGGSDHSGSGSGSSDSGGSDSGGSDSSGGGLGG